IDWKGFCCLCQLLIAHFCFGLLLQRINPAVSYSIRKLLLLAPCDTVWQIVFESFPQDPLLDAPLADHLILRVDAHGDVDKFFIKERNPSFNTPGRKRFVSTKTVV